MLTVDQLKEMLGLTDDRDLAKKFGVTKQAVSNWRVNGVPAKIELRAVSGGGGAVIIPGSGNHIDINHCAEKPEEYSPSTAMILDIIKTWDEKRRQKLAAKIVMMNGDEEP